MAKKKKTEFTTPSSESVDILGVDSELGLYELTDLFYTYYKYHNEDCQTVYTDYSLEENNKVVARQVTLPRLKALRKMEAVRLGQRPFFKNIGNAAHRPNISFNYLSYFLKFGTLPLKAMLTESDLINIDVDRRLFQRNTFTEKELADYNDLIKQQPLLDVNKEVSQDVTSTFFNLIKKSKKSIKAFKQMPRRFMQDAFVAILHSDLSWQPQIIDAIDFIFEPQSEWDTSKWSNFFVIRKMTTREITQHIKANTKYWNTNALRWALESSLSGRGVIDRNHNLLDPAEHADGENFSVKSYYQDKSQRQMNLDSYYGNMIVVEGYYTNTKGKVNKVIFFPSTDFYQIPLSDRLKRASLKETQEYTEENEELRMLEFGDVLFKRDNVFDSIEDALTVIPFDPSDLSLERQRGLVHDTFGAIDMLMRIDSSVLNYALLLSVAFYKNINRGTDGSTAGDMTISFDGEMQDIGDREFVQVPIRGDLNGVMAVRAMLLDEIRSKFFLGGLDGQEMTSSGRGANLANLRLIRDGRVYKHIVEDFAIGLQNVFTKMFKSLITSKTRTELVNDVLTQKNFFDVIFKVYGHDEKLFEYKDSDIVEETGLPYWFNVKAIRNGGSHFGAAELVLYSEVKNNFADTFDQAGMSKLNRMAVRSILGSDDARDIFGDPQDQLVTDQDQIYRAVLENAIMMGSVDQGAVNFEKIITLAGKDDDFLHLQEAHLPKMQEIRKILEENEVSPKELEAVSDTVLESRVTLILKLMALANHSSIHLQGLGRFGNKRPDINRLREEVNYEMQSAEGLFNSMQLMLRMIETKQQEKEARLANISPENTLEQEKIAIEREKINAIREKTRMQQDVAVLLADQKRSQHIDSQVSKYRDREVKIKRDQADIELKKMEIMNKERPTTQTDKG